IFLVPGTGLEPARLAALDPQSSASANSAIPAYCVVRLSPALGTTTNLIPYGSSAAGLYPGGCPRKLLQSDVNIPYGYESTPSSTHDWRRTAVVEDARNSEFVWAAREKAEMPPGLELRYEFFGREGRMSGP